MAIFKAIGLGILILVLQSLVPTIFSQLEATTLAFLRGAEVSASVATGLAASAASATEGTHSNLFRPTPDFAMPQARRISY